MPIGRGVLEGQPRIASGYRDKEVTIERATEPSGGSFPVPTWATVRTEWMSKHEQRADERYSNNTDSAFRETVWACPYAADIDPDLVDVPKTLRLVYQDRVYNIRSATTIGRGYGVEFITMAQTAG